MLITSPSQRMWGRFEHALDDKGRVTIPQRFRETLGDRFALTIGPDHHIRAYPMPVWEMLESQLIGTSLYDELDPDLLFLQRMFGSCEFVSPDRESRLSIPRHLREWAGMEEGEVVVIIGSGTRLEIWSRSHWREWSERLTEEEASRASRNRLGITPPNTSTQSSSSTPTASPGSSESQEVAN